MPCTLPGKTSRRAITLLRTMHAQSAVTNYTASVDPPRPVLCFGNKATRAIILCLLKGLTDISSGYSQSNPLLRPHSSYLGMEMLSQQKRQESREHTQFIDSKASQDRNTIGFRKRGIKIEVSSISSRHSQRTPSTSIMSS